MPGDDLKGLIAWLQANPDKASAGHGGVGSASHVFGALFRVATAARFQLVPYRGNAPATQDLLAGRIDMLFDSPATALPHVRSGRIKVYAVTAKGRLPSRPRSRPQTRRGCRALTFRHGTRFGLRRVRRKKSSTSSTAQSYRHCAIRPCVNGSPSSGRKFQRRSSRPRRRSLNSNEPRSTNGGR